MRSASPIRFPSPARDDGENEESQGQTLDVSSGMEVDSSKNNGNGRVELHRFSAPKRPRPATERNLLNGNKGATFVPSAGIRFLAERGHLVVVEVSEMLDEGHAEFRKRRWRACYYNGRDANSEIMGIGEGPRKVLAKECAALDFIGKMREALPHVPLENFVVPKGCRISPMVMNALELLCKRTGLSAPIYHEDIIFLNDREKFKYTITIDEQEYSEISFILKYAKCGAAKKAFDALNDRGFDFKLDEVIKGDDCLQGAEYGFVESEELHVVFADSAPPNRIRSWETYSVPSESASPVPWPESDTENGSSSGRSTPASGCGPQTKRIKVAAVGELRIPPNLEKIRKRIQEQRNNVMK